MLRWIVLLQSITYLIVMPMLRAFGELGYKPPVLIGVLATIAFLAGAFLPRNLITTPDVSGERSHLPVLGPHPQLWILIVLLSLLYDISSWQYNLLDRRQGSEAMAEIYATLPLGVLAIIRGYELIFVPVLIVYLFSEANTTNLAKLVVVAAIIISLPFMGIINSRGRIPIIAINIIAFVPVSVFIVYAVKNVKAIIGIGVVIFTFFYFSAVRSSAYYSLRDYLQVEIFQRLDGLNIVTQLREANIMSYWGSWDFSVMAPLISKIPFLEAAQAAKLEGRTSSKQYYIQDLLKSRRLDDSSSMINDPLYVSGIIGMIVCFVVLGLCCWKFDRFVANKPFTHGRPRLALALAFLASFLVFEVDFVSALATTAQTWLILLVLLFLGCRWEQAEVRVVRNRRGGDTGTRTISSLLTH